jgi:ABC-type branched-subunit amino acid transport system ATPase component
VTHSHHQPHLALQARIQTAKSRAGDLRLWSFLAAAGFALLTWWQGWPWSASGAPIAVAIGLFIRGVILWNRIQAIEDRLAVRTALQDRLLATRALDWSRIPAAESEAMAAAEKDLPRDEREALTELTARGSRSLFTLADWTFTPAGRAQLSERIRLMAPSRVEFDRRQVLSRHFQARPVLLWKFLTSGHLNPELSRSFTRLGQRIQIPLTPTWLPVALGGLTALHLLFLIGAVLDSPRLFGFGFGGVVVSLFVLIRYTSLAEAYPRAMEMSLGLRLLRDVGQALGMWAASVERSGREEWSAFRGDNNPRTHLKSTDRVVAALGVRQNFIIHIGLNLLGPWDVFWLWRLESERSRLAKLWPRWAEQLAEAEVVASCAAYARARTDASWPTLTTEAFLETEDLRHPLIDPKKVVGNSTAMTAEQRIVLITGSNMSGKSTWLRTLSLALLASQAGLPVTAQTLSHRLLTLAAAVGVHDSLEQGLSRFYAEARRLGQLLRMAQERSDVFFLIDEILSGTNNRERLQGSKSLVQALSQTQATGLVTTHDLELAQLEGSVRGLINQHFTDQFAGGELRFDHRLRGGPSQTTNALAILAREGLPV